MTRAPRFEAAFRRSVEALGGAWEEIAYPRPGGETTAYRLSPPAPPRAVALALHGAGNDALFAWVATFRSLLRRGVEVFTFHLDGHGRDGTTRFSAATAVDSVRAALARSCAEARGLPVHALGASLGGALLLAALPSVAPPVASAVLMVAPLRIHLSWRAVRGEVGLPLLGAVRRGRADYGWTGLIPSFGPFRRGLYPLRLAEEPPAGTFGYVEVLNRALEELRLEDAARRVRVPTLLVYGERDRLVPAAQGERLAGLIPGAELRVLPGGTHLGTPLAPEVVEGVAAWVGGEGGSG